MLGWPWLYDQIATLAKAAAALMPQAAGFVAWAVTAFFDGIFGVVLGMLLIPLATRVIAPLWGMVTGKQKAAQ